jgi:hypothetical protein
MWMRETPDGIEVDVDGAMAEIDKRRAAGHKRIKKVRETTVDISAPENDEMIVMKVGGRYFKLMTVKESSNIEDFLKEDYNRQLIAEKEKLAAETKAAMDEFKSFAEHTLNESQEEIRKLQTRLRNAAPMPEIGFIHAKAGLSVVKGEGGHLLWLYNTVYNPQFIDGRPLSAAIIKKMVTPMIILITTRGDDVIGIETKTLGLDGFRHYHRHGSDSRRNNLNSDCWGQWKWAGTKWKTPEDILKLGKEATNILVNINSHSLACHAPLGLPRYSTVETHLVARSEAPVEDVSLNQTQLRTGMDAVIERRGGWTVRPRS